MRLSGPLSEEPLIPFSFPTHTLSLSLFFSLSLSLYIYIQPAKRHGQRCTQLLSDALTLEGGRTGLDWMVLPRLLLPKG